MSLPVRSSPSELPNWPTHFVFACLAEAFGLPAEHVEEDKELQGPRQAVPRNIGHRIWERAGRNGPGRPGTRHGRHLRFCRCAEVPGTWDRSAGAVDARRDLGAEGVAKVGLEVSVTNDAASSPLPELRVRRHRHRGLLRGALGALAVVAVRQVRRADRCPARLIPMCRGAPLGRTEEAREAYMQHIGAPPTAEGFSSGRSPARRGDTAPPSRPLDRNRCMATRTGLASGGFPGRTMPHIIVRSLLTGRVSSITLGRGTAQVHDVVDRAIETDEAAIPGVFDMQVNGAGLYDLNSPNVTTARMAEVAQLQWKFEQPNSAPR